MLVCLGLGWCIGQDEFEGGALPRFAGDADRAMMRFSNETNQTQPNADAAFMDISGRVRTIEQVEYIRQMIGVDAFPIIADSDDEIVLITGDL
mgnify:CR=1 FL=1